MKFRTFGRLGWQVSEVGYGMWGLAGWTGSDDDLTRQSLQLSVDRGCNFFDTALAYGEGASERMLGELVRANPNKTLYTASKIPPRNRTWPSRRYASHKRIQAGRKIERLPPREPENAQRLFPLRCAQITGGMEATSRHASHAIESRVRDLA